MSFNNNSVAQLLEHSSRADPNSDADPLLLLVRTLDVHTPDIARVVLRIYNLKMLARNMDSRLQKKLLDDVHGYWISIASLLSVNGKGLKYLTTETKSYKFSDTTKKTTQTMKEIFMGDAGQTQGGVQIPGD